MHFYELTRLGSMLALPMVFPDLVTEAALTEARKFLLDKAKKEQEDEEKRKAAQEAVDAGTEGAELLPEPEPIEPTDATIPKTSEVKIALCLDTLCMAGDGEKVVDQKHIDALDGLCKAVAECKARYDHFGVWQQAAAWKDEDPEPFKAAKQTAVGNAEAAVTAAKASEDLQDAKEQDIALVEAEHRFAAYKELLEQFKDDIFALKNLPIVPDAACTAVCAAALFSGIPADVVSSRATKLPVWEKCRQALPTIVEKVVECKPTGERTGLEPSQRLVFVQEMVAKLPTEDAAAAPEAATPVALQCLYLWLQAAVDLRDKDVKIRMEKPEGQTGACDDAGIEA